LGKPSETEALTGGRCFERPSTHFTVPADLLLAMGFVHVVPEGLRRELNLKLDGRGNVSVYRWMTSEPGIFAAGDTVRGTVLGASPKGPRYPPRAPGRGGGRRVAEEQRHAVVNGSWTMSKSRANPGTRTGFDKMGKNGGWRSSVAGGNMITRCR